VGYLAENLSQMLQVAIYKIRYADHYTKLGVGMLCAAFLLLLFVVMSLQNNAKLKVELSKPLPTFAPEINKAKPSEMAQKFYQLLPNEHQADAISAQILRSADSLGMVFEHAEFKSIPVDDTHLVVQHIKLPLKGNYIQIRQFLNALLNAYPSLALTDLTLQRDDATSDQVASNIEFTLYLRKGQM
jgi:Tfp pilus assembly protein PilO